ncbi:MAG: hypothetical protein ABSE62_08040 [Chthoniobacteraceae bacterium]|jgi:hypothetical protein
MYFPHEKADSGSVKLLSRCFYHPRTSSLITDRNLLDAGTVGGLLNLLPEEERHGLKYVTVCLEDGVAGDIDRDSLVAALEVFGQIRDSGVNPKDLFRELEEKEIKLAPAVKAREVAATPGRRQGTAARRSVKSVKKTARPGMKKRVR